MPRADPWRTIVVSTRAAGGPAILLVREDPERFRRFAPRLIDGEADICEQVAVLLGELRKGAPLAAALAPDGDRPRSHLGES